MVQGLAYRPGSISRVAAIIEVRIRSVDDCKGIHEFGNEGVIVWSHLQNLSDNRYGWMGFDSGRYHNAIRSPSSTSNSEEQITVLARIRSDDGAAGKDHLRLEDLICTQTKIARGWRMPSALRPASDATYGLRFC